MHNSHAHNSHAHNPHAHNPHTHSYRREHHIKRKAEPNGIRREVHQLPAGASVSRVEGDVRPLVTIPVDKLWGLITQAGVIIQADSHRGCVLRGGRHVPVGIGSPQGETSSNRKNRSSNFCHRCRPILRHGGKSDSASNQGDRDWLVAVLNSVVTGGDGLGALEEGHAQGQDRECATHLLVGRWEVPAC